MTTINYAEISEMSVNVELAAMTSPIHIAAVNGEKSTIELLLKNNSPDDYKCDVNEEDTFGRTALVYTVFGDWYDCAELLLRNKASVNKEDRDKRTALHWAAYLGKPKFVNLFLQHVERGGDCNPPDLEGRTPLHYAVAQEDSKCLRLLLKRVVASKIDVTDDEKKTALHWSAYYGYLGHVKILMKAKANPQLRDIQYNTLLHLAVANPQSPDAVRIVRHLLKLKPFFSVQKNYLGLTPLHLAVANESEELARELCSAHVQALDEVDKESRSALHYAVLRNNVDIVRILISSRAFLYIEDNSGATPLHYAAKNNNFELIAFLALQTKLEDIPDHEGRTALMWAASEDAVDVLDLMLRYPGHFNAHACDNQGLTPLHFACMAGNERCVTLLISKSSNASQVDKLGQTPLFKACQQGNLDVVKILTGSKTPPDGVAAGGASVVERRAGHTVTVVDHDGFGGTTGDFDGSAETWESENRAGDNTGKFGDNRASFLVHPEGENKHCPNGEEPDNNGVDRHQCGHNGDEQNAEQSNGNIANGVKTNESMEESTSRPGTSEDQKESIRNHEDFNGRTPLHFAAHAGHVRVCRLLLEKKVEPGKKDSCGRIALHGAALNGHTDYINTILSCRPELVDERDLDGSSALHWAASNGHLEAVKILVNVYGAFPNFRVTSSNLTPLDLAIAGDQQDVTQFLIDHGALTIAGVQQMASDTIKRYLMLWLSKRKRKSLEPLLLKHRMLTRVEAGKKDSCGRIALHGAALNGHTDYINTILSCRPELVDERDLDGSSALHWAASNGHLEAVKILVNVYGAFPNFRVTSSNLTPLDLAIAGDQQDVTQFLIDHGALTIAGVQQIASDTIKRYLMLWLSKRKRKSLESLLLKHRMLTREESAKNSENASGATDGVVDTNHSLGKQGEPDTTPFGFQGKPSGRSAVALEVRPAKISNLVGNPSRNQEMTQAVISPPLGCSNERGLTENDACVPPSVACFPDGAEQSQLVDTIGEHFPFFYDFYENAFFEPCRLGYLDIVDSLIAADQADVEARDENSCTPLHLAACHGHAAVCRRLLEKGADLGKRDMRGQTALHHAALNGHSTCIQLLLEKTPDLVHFLDRENRSALHCAASNGHLEAVALLLQTYNAQPNVSTKPKNLTALDCAIIGNHRNVVDLLLEHAAETSCVLESAAKIITRNARAWLIRARRSVGPLSATRQSGGDAENKEVLNESDVAEDKPRSVDNDSGQQSAAHDLATKHASDPRKPDSCKHDSRKPGSDFEKLESNCASATPPPTARIVSQNKHPRVPDHVVVAGERDKILRLRRDWERIALVRSKIQAAVIIQNCFRKYLQRKTQKLGDVGKSEKNTPLAEVENSSGVANSSKGDKKPFLCRTHLAHGRKLSGNRLPRNTPPDRSFVKKKKIASCKGKETFKSCFPPLLQTIDAASSPNASSKSPTCCSGSRSPRSEERGVVSCRAPQLTKNELVKQWLEKDKSERGKTQANAAHRQNGSRRTTNKSEKSFLRSHSLPEDGPVAQRAIPNTPRTTVGLRSRSLKYPRPRSPMSTGHRPLARESLAQNTFPSPAAVSYNFALDTYHPLASRQGCKQPAFPYKTSTRVRPSSMKRGKNGWVHTRKFAEAMASSESSYSR